MAEQFDPYHRWLGIPPKQQPANLYRLLAIELFESDAEVIRDAAEQRMAHVRSYHLGPNSELSQKILNELAAAKAKLLAPAEKAAYDASLRATLAGPSAGVPGSTAPARDLSDLLTEAEQEAAPLPELSGSPRRRRKWLPTGRKGVPASRPMPRPSHRYSARWPRSLWALVGVPAVAVALILVLLLWFSGNARDVLRAMGLVFQATEMAGQSPDPGSPSSRPLVEPLPAGPSPPPNPSPSAAPPLAVAPFDAQRAREHQEAWAKHLGVPVETTNSIGMKLVLIPPGEFEMGSTREEVDQLLKDAKEREESPSWCVLHIPTEAPRHRVRLTKPFYLANCEVTMGAFQKFVAETGFKTDAERDGKGGAGFDARGLWRQIPEYVWNNSSITPTESHPVVNVSWNDAAAFCEWLSRKESMGYRLPTEAEWEYAGRAGSTTHYSFGNEATSLGEYAWYVPNSGNKTHPVGEKRPNSLGLQDMHGNVWEWCADWYVADYYAKSPVNDPSGPDSGESRILRGGSRGEEGISLFRCAYRRHGVPPGYCEDRSGFRVARNCSQKDAPSAQPSVEKPLPPPVPASKPMPKTDNAPPPSNVVYLDDLREVDFSVGFGRLGKHGDAGDGVRKCTIGGRLVTHSLFPHPKENGYSYVAYQLDDQYETFRSTVLNDSATSLRNLEFEVRGDGKPLWTSGTLTRKGSSNTCHVSVSGVRMLDLRIYCRGSADSAWGWWVEPRLEKTAGTRPAPPPTVAPDDEAKANQRKSAQQLGVPITLTNTIGMKFVLIPPGEFLMGSPNDERQGLAERPQHRVTITKPFYLGAYEVTQLEFARMMRANPSNFKGDMKRPVEQVTWNHAVEFCRRLSAKERVRYRLPTEAEWEYACRAGSTTRYCFGDSESQLGEFAWYSDNSGKTTHPVGQKKPNAWGFFDMHGNVWEWCADWYGTNYYRESPPTDPTGPTTGSGRVSRGGGFDPAAVHCRSAKRGDLFLVNGVYLALGFRVVRAAE